MPQEIFNKKLKRMQRNKAAKHLNDYDFLLQVANDDIFTILNEEINAELSNVLNIGCGNGQLSKQLSTIASVKNIINCDSAQNMSAIDLVADEEFIPFKNDSFNLITSSLAMHWTNDFLGSLIQIRNCLRDKGLFIATIFGGSTLYELRQAAIEAEIDSGVSPRISPTIQLKDAAALLQHAGFHIPVAHAQTITVTYDNAVDLMYELKYMGENNALIQKSRKLTTKSALNRISQKYQELFASAEGQIPATFELITMTGWKN